MEESEKRRERLKAMRTEASQAGVGHQVGPESLHLSNPFSETSAAPPLQNNPSTTPRFDYYTDPMAAFSADKRSKLGNQNSQHYSTPPKPGNPEMTPSSAHQLQTNYSPDQRMYQVRGPYQSSRPMTPSPSHQFQPNYSPNQVMHQTRGPYHNPGPMTPSPSHQVQTTRPCYNSGPMTPSPSHQVQPNYSPNQTMYQPQSPFHSSGPMTPSPAHQVQPNYSPDQRTYQARGPFDSPGPYGSPIGMASPLGPPQGSSYYRPPNSSVGNFSSPRFGGGSPSSYSGQGRGRWFSNSPASGSGFRGTPSSSSNFGRGRSGGHRGFGSRETLSAELRPDLYYNKSMVEDPWKLLEPVVWKKVNVLSKSWNTPDSHKSVVPKFGGVKKARMEGGSNESSSEPSLAEYLAAALKEAGNDGSSNDKPGL